MAKGRQNRINHLRWLYDLFRLSVYDLSYDVCVSFCTEYRFRTAVAGQVAIARTQSGCYRQYTAVPSAVYENLG